VIYLRIYNNAKRVSRKLRARLRVRSSQINLEDQGQDRESDEDLKKEWDEMNQKEQ
jgi:hypothetical protein